MNYHSYNFKKQHCESFFFKKSCPTLVVVDELEVVDEVELLDRVELVRLWRPTTWQGCVRTECDYSPTSKVSCQN